MKLFKLVALNFVCIVVANRCAFAESIDARFEERYATWKAWIATNKFRSTYTACKEYYDIIALGVSAIPFMIGKMEECFDDFHLSTAVSIVSKREFDKTEWPAEKLGDSKTAAKLYVHWWRVGRFQTGTRFYELYARWSKFNIERELGEADRVYKQIVNLGIPVLPYLIEIIDKSPEFVAAVSILSGDALPKNASLEETKTWWEKNKEQFTLPPAEDVLPQRGACL